MSRIRICTALLAVAGGLVFAGTALADDPAVIDQYQVPIPAAGGSQHGGGGNQGGGSGGQVSLPGSTQQHLQSSVSAPVASALETVATSPSLGAPQTTLKKKPKTPAGQTAMTREEKDTAPNVQRPANRLAGNPLDDAVSAAADGGNAHLLAVLVALAVITLAGAALAARRSRREPRV